MINTREIAAEYRLSYWERIMGERIESGLSIKDYCKRIGICGNTYFYWQRRVREATCQELIALTPDKTTMTDNSLLPSAVPRAEWLEVREASAENAGGGKTLPIEINGCRVLAGSDVDTELLAKVCRVLVSLC